MLLVKESFWLVVRYILRSHVIPHSWKSIFMRCALFVRDTAFWTVVEIGTSLSEILFLKKDSKGLGWVTHFRISLREEVFLTTGRTTRQLGVTLGQNDSGQKQKEQAEKEDLGKILQIASYKVDDILASWTFLTSCWANFTFWPYFFSLPFLQERFYIFWISPREAIKYYLA